MLSGFRQFIMRGNMVDLAVGVVIGSAFGNTINSLVKDILTPFIAAIVQTPDFSSLYFTLNSSKFTYGAFLNNLISFILVSLAIYFFVLVPMNKFVAQFKKGEVPPEPDMKKCPECISDIPRIAKRCKYCSVAVA